MTAPHIFAQRGSGREAGGRTEVVPHFAPQAHTGNAAFRHTRRTQVAPYFARKDARMSPRISPGRAHERCRGRRVLASPRFQP